MKRLILLGFALTLLACPAMASPTLTLLPTNGDISGQPGTTIGWGFSITNTENFLIPTSFQFLPSSTLGTFTDFTGEPFYNFFVVGPGYPDGTTVTQAFDPNLGTGVGSFTIANTASLWQSAIGNIIMTYDLYSVSPYEWDSLGYVPDPIATDQVLTVAARVNVVPLPGAVWLLGSGLLGLVGLKRKLLG